MRESKLLLLRNLAPQPTKKLNANLLSSLVAYNNRPNRLMKSINIPPGNISLSPEKKRK